MATVNLSDSLIKKAKRYAIVDERSLAKQIEHWANIGRMLEETPDSTYSYLRSLMLEETK